MIIRPLTIMAEKVVDPLNPLGLPPYTIRVKYSDGITPTPSKGTISQVSSSPNVWDVTYENSDWQNMFSLQTNLIEVLGANTTGVTNIGRIFYNCGNLTNVSLFNTSSVTNMRDAFAYNMKLTIIPLFNTSNVTDMLETFWYCRKVESGALALYQQASTQANPPTNHNQAFGHCGELTTTGAAELAQIPSSWGGTGA